MNSKADRYRDNVKRHMDGGSKGTIVMVAIFVLSAVLSALFFWRHSTGVFAGIPWIFATVLGLLAPVTTYCFSPRSGFARNRGSMP